MNHHVLFLDRGPVTASGAIVMIDQHADEKDSPLLQRPAKTHQFHLRDRFLL
jgi:hypothetical protein